VGSWPYGKAWWEVHIAVTRRHYKGLSTRHAAAALYREGGKVRNETVGNLSHLEEWMIDGLRAMLAGALGRSR